MQQVAVFTGFPGDETERAGGGSSPTPPPLPRAKPPTLPPPLYPCHPLTATKLLSGI